MTKKQDAWSVVLLFDPLAIPLTRKMVSWGATPTPITLASLALGILAAIVGATARGPVMGGLTALGYYCSFLLDCIDGKVARLRQMTSRRGALLDLMGDAWKTLAFSIALITRAWSLSFSWFVITLWTVLGLYTIKIVADLRGQALERKAEPILQPVRPRWLPARFVNGPSSIDVEVLMYGVWLPGIVGGINLRAALAAAAAIVTTRVLREMYGTVVLATRGN